MTDLTPAAPEYPALDPAIIADLDELDRREAELARLRAAMLSALSATDARLAGDESTEFLCLGADEIRAHIKRVKAERDALRAERDNLDRELRATTKQGIGALGAATAERDALREEMREAKADAERAKEERNRIRVEVEREWRGKVDAATARGDRYLALLRRWQEHYHRLGEAPIEETVSAIAGEAE